MGNKKTTAPFVSVDERVKHHVVNVRLWASNDLIFLARKLEACGLISNFEDFMAKANLNALDQFRAEVDSVFQRSFPNRPPPGAPLRTNVPEGK